MREVRFYLYGGIHHGLVYAESDLYVTVKLAYNQGWVSIRKSEIL